MERTPIPAPFGRYLITRRLSTGGMADVFRARQVGGGSRWVALKILRATPEAEAVLYPLFLREVRITRVLRHENVVAAVGAGVEGGRAFLALEYLSGCELRQLIGDARSGDWPLPVELALYLAHQVARGLGYAHRLVDTATGAPLGLVHRDVSPANVVVGYDGGVRIIDFGVARTERADDGLTKEHVLRGKFSYMSPEQIRGEPLDARSDVFALGTLLYELLSGHNPYRSSNPALTMERIRLLRLAPVSRTRRGIPPEVDRVLMRCCAKEPRHRYRDAAAVAVDLASILGASCESARAGLVRYLGAVFAYEQGVEARRLAEETAALAAHPGGRVSVAP